MSTLGPDRRAFIAPLAEAMIPRSQGMPGASDIALVHAPLDRVHSFEQRFALFETPPFRVRSFGLYSSFTRKSAPSLYRLEAEYPLQG